MPSIEERFWKYVDKTESCWNWIGATRGGYGNFTINKKSIKTHRYSFELHNHRVIQDKMFILHSCDNPSCVNPAHLREGTQQENVNDKMIRRRHNCYKKITQETADKIRAEYAIGTITQKELAEKYGLKQSCTISAIIRNKIWIPPSLGEINL